MSDKDSKLLNLYLDGELPDEHRKGLLESNQEEYSQLLKLRSELRGHFQKKLETNISKERSEMIWDKIEAEIKKPVVKQKPWYYIPVKGYAFAAMCSLCAFVLGANLHGQSEINLFKNLTKSLTGSKVVESELAQSKLRKSNLLESSLKYVRQDFKQNKKRSRVHQIAVFDKQNKNVFHRLPIDLGTEFDTEQLIGFNDKKSVALRSNGLDIDWMESDKNYKLVKSTVPVIWVSD